MFYSKRDIKFQLHEVLNVVTFLYFVPLVEFQQFYSGFACW